MHTTIAAPTRRFNHSHCFDRLVRFAASAFALVAAFAISLSAVTPAHAHDVLVGTSPVGSAESGEAPAIMLEFNNEIMQIGSEMIATAADGSTLLEGEPVVSGRTVTQQLVADLADGKYTVAWRVVSSDSHPIQGVVAVAMSGGYPVSVEPTTLANDDSGDSADSSDSDDSSNSAESNSTESNNKVTSQKDDGSAGTVWGVVAIVAILAATAGLLTISAKKFKKS